MKFEIDLNEKEFLKAIEKSFSYSIAKMFDDNKLKPVKELFEASVWSCIGKRVTELLKTYGEKQFEEFVEKKVGEIYKENLNPNIDVEKIVKNAIHKKIGKMTDEELIILLNKNKSNTK